MAENISPVAMKFCPVCGKKFFALYPQLWAYKRGEKKGIKWFCSWHCLRAEENRITIKERGDAEMNRLRLTDAQKLEAVRMAINGDDPRPYLRECGSVNADALWGSIRLWIQGKDPETAAKLPKVIGHKPRKPVETPEGEFTEQPKAAPAAKTETPETPKISKPVGYNGMTVREIEGAFGRYRRTDTRESTYIDFEFTEDQDVYSYSLDQWRAFRKEQENAFAILGVEL